MTQDTLSPLRESTIGRGHLPWLGSPAGYKEPLGNCVWDAGNSQSRFGARARECFFGKHHCDIQMLGLCLPEGYFEDTCTLTS